MDQSSRRTTSLGRHLKGLASFEKGSDADSLSETNDSSDEYPSLEWLDKSLSEPMQTDEVWSLVALLSPDISNLQVTNES